MKSLLLRSDRWLRRNPLTNLPALSPQWHADACCAAAWVQLPAEVLTPETITKLKAIAWDCDHLTVPEELKQYAEFAAKAVVALKNSSEGIAGDLRLPHERKEWVDEHWEAYSSEAFRRGTEWLMAAARGDCPYPSESVGLIL